MNNLKTTLIRKQTKKENYFNGKIRCDFISIFLTGFKLNFTLHLLILMTP